MLDKTIKTFQEFFSQEGRLFRYSLSYCFLLALFPTLIITVILFQNNILDIHNILPFVYQFIPQEVIEPFIEYVMSKDYHTLTSMIVSLVVSSYLASNSFYSFMLISANHEEFETYGILIRIKAIILFAIFVLGIAGVAIATHVLQLHFVLIVLIGIFVVFYIFYRTLSFEKRPWQYGLPGAIFTTLALIVVGYLFLYIISIFTSYENIYGPLASIMILLLSIYVVSSIIYFGYCLNDNFAFSHSEKEYKNIKYYCFGEKWLGKLEDLVMRFKR